MSRQLLAVDGQCQRFQALFFVHGGFGRFHPCRKHRVGHGEVMAGCRLTACGAAPALPCRYGRPRRFHYADRCFCRLESSDAQAPRRCRHDPLSRRRPPDTCQAGQAFDADGGCRPILILAGMANGEKGSRHFEEFFRFVLPGYNLRPLEMSGGAAAEIAGNGCRATRECPDVRRSFLVARSGGNRPEQLVRLCPGIDRRCTDSTRRVDGQVDRRGSGCARGISPRTRCSSGSTIRCMAAWRMPSASMSEAFSWETITLSLRDQLRHLRALIG